MNEVSGRPRGRGASADERQLRTRIAERVAGLAGVSQEEIEPDRPLADYGLSSRDAVTLAGYLETLLGRPLPATIVWEQPTISSLTRFMLQDDGPERHPSPATEPIGTGDPIAVIGIGCRFPGGPGGALTHPGALWRFLRDGGNAVREVPAQRWAWFWERSGTSRAAEVTRWAGVLDDVDGFDARFFGISPAEATTMDPQQRMLLEVSWEALEHAGLAPRSLAGSRTGVFAGISATEYAHVTAADPARVDAWTATGVAPSVAAGRISYLLDFRGPSLAVDTACSSSLVAVHLAAASLRDGECDLALAGGVNLLLSPVITMAFDAGGGTSPDGRCSPFDVAANGLVRGEGCGIVVLKRLPDARRDGDRVLAVLAGGSVGCDGRSNGLVAPNGEAQRDLLHRAYRSAGIDPATVGYVEAHGTGTPLGDPIEAHALGEVLGAGRPPDRPLYIGSVKSNIGHLEAAAGVAGLIKAVLALSNRQIPPSANFTKPSPHIPFRELGLAVPADTLPWPDSAEPARAGVSAFGFSGTNAHVVLETPRTSSRTRAPLGGPASLVLSDVSRDRVRDHAGHLARWLGQDDAPEPAEIAGSLARRAGRGQHRSVVVGSGNDELREGLAALGAGRPHPAVISGVAAGAGPGAVFVFSGFGSQWAGMGRLLAESEPAFADAIEDLEEDIQHAAGVSLRAAIGGDAPGPDLTRVDHVQPVLFGLQVALAWLWAAYGVIPSAVIGHSMGEVAAAVVSGKLTVREGARVIASRSRLLSGIVGGGAMALIGLPTSEIAELRAGLPDVHVAVISSPEQSVITGDPAQVAELARRAEARGAPARVLQADGAGHSPQVDPLVPPLMSELEGVGGTARASAVAFYSSVTDDPRAEPACDPAYWAANMRRPVRFGPAVTAAAEDGFRVFVEVSPHTIVGHALADTLRHYGCEDAVVTGTLRKNANDVLTFHRQLATLTAAGITTGPPAHGPLVDLPPAPWQHDRYWARAAPPIGAPDRHRLLGAHVELPGGRGHAWSNRLTPPALADLRIRWHGRHILPLAAAAEMAAAAGCEAWDVAADDDVVLSDLRLERLVAVGQGLEVTTTLEETGALRIHAKNAAGRWILAASADVFLERHEEPPEPAGPIEARLTAACQDPADMPTAVTTLRIRGRAAVEARDVTVFRVTRDELPVAHEDKLFHRSWERQRSPSARDSGGRWRLLTADGHHPGFASALAAALGAGGPAPTGDLLPDDHGTGVAIIAPQPPVSSAAAERFAADVIRIASDVARRAGTPPRLWLITRGAIPARPGDPGDPGLAATQGLIRVLAIERPALRVSLADADPGQDPVTAADAVAAELLADNADDEVAWRDGHRLVARLARAEARPGPKGRPVVRPGGSYVITGGYGGLGLVVARWLARRGAGRLVLSGRSGPPPEDRTVRELRDQGTDVEVIRGDVAAPGVAARLIEAAADGGASVRGVVHAAGVFGDALLTDVTPEGLARVWAPKVRGAEALHEALASVGAEPDWVVLFSSAAALLGSPGQSAYASANGWLDGFAHWRTARGLPTFSIGWGVWNQVGRATDVAIGGIDPLSPDEAVEDLEALLAQPRPVTAVLRVDPARTTAAFPEISAIPFFGSVFTSEPAQASPAGATVRSIVAGVLGLPETEIPADLALTDAGLDSLAAQRIVGLLARETGVKIEASALLRGATLADLEGAGDGPEPTVGPRDVTERWVLRVVVDVLSDADLGVTHDLRQSGLTAESRREITARLAVETGLTLDPDDLLRVPTVAAAAERIRAARAGSDLMPLIRPPARGRAVRPSLLLAHPAGEDTGIYKMLAGLLDDDRPVLGLERLPGSVDERARAYSTAITSRFPDQPCVLGGWSFGGVLAYETARRLAAAGQPPDLVVLLDAALPLPVAPEDEGRLLARRFAAFAGYLTKTYGKPVDLNEQELSGLPEDAQLALLIERMAQSGVTAELSPSVLRHQLTSHEDTRVLEGYVAGPYDGPVVLYRADQPTPWAVRDPRYEITDQARGWGSLCPRLEVLPVDAHHLNLLDPPAVGTVATHLRALLATGGVTKEMTDE